MADLVKIISTKGEVLEVSRANARDFTVNCDPKWQYADTSVAIVEDEKPLLLAPDKPKPDLEITIPVVEEEKVDVPEEVETLDVKAAQEKADAVEAEVETEEKPKKRTRRTKAQIEADNAEEEANEDV